MSKNEEGRSKDFKLFWKLMCLRSYHGPLDEKIRKVLLDLKNLFSTEIV